MSLRTLSRISSAFSLPTEAIEHLLRLLDAAAGDQVLGLADVAELLQDLGGFLLLDVLGAGDLPGDALHLLGGHVPQDPRGLVLAEEHEELGGLAVSGVPAGFLDEAAEARIELCLSLPPSAPCGIRRHPVTWPQYYRSTGERSIDADTGHSATLRRRSAVMVSGLGPMRVPVSRPVIRAMSAASSWKSKTLLFSSIVSRCTDFGMVTTPSCRSQRSTTCAGVFPCLLCDFRDHRVVEAAPRVRGDHASCRMPCLRVEIQQLLLHEEGVELHLVHRGPTGRMTSARSSRWCTRKLLTPMALTFPSASSFSRAFHVSRYFPLTGQCTR